MQIYANNACACTGKNNILVDIDHVEDSVSERESENYKTKTVVSRKNTVVDNSDLCSQA